MNLRKNLISSIVFILFIFPFFSHAQETKNKGSGPVCMKITTEYGDMKVLLYDETPLHRDNFVKLVNSGFYNDLLFHRVISQFMIQGGDPESKNAQPNQMLGTGGPGYTIPAEIKRGFYHKKGALAAARLGDNVNPNRESSGSQFYIVQGKVFTQQEIFDMKTKGNMTLSLNQERDYKTIGGTPWLDDQYTVFGQIIEGLGVIDKIAEVKCGPNNRPVNNIKMKIEVTSCPAKK